MSNVSDIAAARHPEKARNPATQTPRKPEWIRVRAPISPEYQQTRDLMRRLKLNTVCEEAACPNIGECWKQKHATVMILGSVCTRACAFCNVATGKPDLLDPHEPEHVAEAVGELGLSHVVVTSVDRDDLDDGGAEHFARVIRAVRERAPGTTIEVLTPDFLQEAGRDRDRRGRASRCLQSQSGDRAAALPAGAAGCALLPFAPAAVAGEGNRSRHVHQVRHHGRSRRNHATRCCRSWMICARPMWIS